MKHSVVLIGNVLLIIFTYLVNRATQKECRSTHYLFHNIDHMTKIGIHMSVANYIFRYWSKMHCRTHVIRIIAVPTNSRPSTSTTWCATSSPFPAAGATLFYKNCSFIISKSPKLYRSLQISVATQIMKRFT